jgi:hypothetical protein
VVICPLRSGARRGASTSTTKSRVRQRDSVSFVLLERAWRLLCSAHHFDCGPSPWLLRLARCRLRREGLVCSMRRVNRCWHGAMRLQLKAGQRPRLPLSIIQRWVRSTSREHPRAARWRQHAFDARGISICVSVTSEPLARGLNRSDSPPLPSAFASRVMSREHVDIVARVRARDRTRHTSSRSSGVMARGKRCSSASRSDADAPLAEPLRRPAKPSTRQDTCRARAPEVPAYVAPYDAEPDTPDFIGTSLRRGRDSNPR